MKTQIEEKRLEELEDIEIKMNALEAGGVDNWEWYGESLKSYHEQKEKAEKAAKVIDEVVEALCEGVEEPAGSGCGFGVRLDCLQAANKILAKFMSS